MYKVKLQSFEGPFDLLVYLIESAEMSIYDIRISEITSQYLDYIQARMTEMQGRYGDAAQMYQALGNDVLDSSERAEECLKKESNEQLQQASALIERGAWQEALEVLNQVDIDVQDEIAYCNAGLLMQSGQYEDARNAYRAISDVRSSQSLADACDTAIDNQSYTEGMTALENGNLEAARTAFEKAGADYLDTESYLDYITAREAEQEERFAEAESLYMLCDGFLDSSTRAISCHTAAQRVKYLEAAVLLGQGRLKAARTIYESLDHYLQTDDYLTYIEGRRLEQQRLFPGLASSWTVISVRPAIWTKSILHPISRRRDSISWGCWKPPVTCLHLLAIIRMRRSITHI